MKHPEDLSWDRVVERIELDASDVDLAAAEQALRGAESEEVRPELIESVLARAQAELAAEAQAPLAMPQPRIRTLPRFRRFAAAAAVFFFGSKLSAAITVTTLVVMTTATVTIVNSLSMPYQQLVDILRSDASSEGQVSAALRDVSVRVGLGIETLKDLRDSVTTTGVQAAITQGLEDLLNRRSLPQPERWMEPKHSAEAAARSHEENEQLFYAQNTLRLAAAGIDAIRRLNVVRFPDLEMARTSALGKLRRTVAK